AITVAARRKPFGAMRSGRTSRRASTRPHPTAVTVKPTRPGRVPGTSAASSSTVTRDAAGTRDARPSASSPGGRASVTVRGSAGRSAQALDQHGHALAAADAQRLEPDGLVEGLQVVEQRRHDAGAGHAERVAE